MSILSILPGRQIGGRHFKFERESEDMILQEFFLQFEEGTAREAEHRGKRTHGVPGYYVKEMRLCSIFPGRGGARVCVCSCSHVCAYVFVLLCYL